MPIYEYNCQECAGDFELLLRTSDAPQCPECGSQRLEKQLSVPAAHSGNAVSLPVCQAPPVGGCGAPQCGGGGGGGDGCMMP